MAAISSENLAVFSSFERLNFPNISRKQNSINIFSAVDNYLDINKSGDFLFSSVLLHGKERDSETYLKILSKLLKKGIVGYEYLDVGNRPYKSFITTRIGDSRLSGKKPYYRNRNSFYV